MKYATASSLTDKILSISLRYLWVVVAIQLALLTFLSLFIFNIYPLTKYQLYYLKNQNKYQDILIVQDLSNEAPDVFYKSIIAKYIIARESVYPESFEDDWKPSTFVQAFSSKVIYTEFSSSEIFNKVKNRRIDFIWIRSVKIKSVSKISSEGLWEINGEFIDTNKITEAVYTLPFKIQITLNFREQEIVKYNRKLDNPAGLFIDSYRKIVYPSYLERSR
ncbi:MAG: hypothetical protein JJV93_01405 [Alphaproteobacteria bacterium]|nr:hypothetical protein [Alphaproteobacteria bacterium]MBL0717906.1 hypothetical protein [Alphaproteobacteria bacterium]